MTPAYIRLRFREAGLAHYASEEKLVEFVAEMMREVARLARTQADAEEVIPLRPGLAGREENHREDH